MYNVVPISVIQQRDPILHIYTLFFQTIHFHYGLSQETGYSSLCYTVGYLSILNVILCIYQSQTPGPSLFLPVPHLATINLISLSVSLFLLLVCFIFLPYHVACGILVS